MSDSFDSIGLLMISLSFWNQAPKNPLQFYLKKIPLNLNLRDPDFSLNKPETESTILRFNQFSEEFRIHRKQIMNEKLLFQYA